MEIFSDVDPSRKYRQLRARQSLGIIVGGLGQGCPCKPHKCRQTGGDGEIRTLDTGLSPYASLAGKCLRPLGHVSTCNPQDSRDFAKGWMIAFSAGLVNLRIFPDQMLYATRVQLTPCISRRSRPKS